MIMAASTRLKVMISSRCLDPFPAGQTKNLLSDIRKDLKIEIEAVEVFGRRLFEVWINEETPPQGGTWDSWDVCLQAVRDCDILIAVSNGNAGWADTAGAIGICHAELMTGLGSAPGKVRLISLPNIPIAKTDEGARNQRFQDYVGQMSLFRGGTVKTVAELKNRVKEALSDALVGLSQAGVREASKGKFYSGEALDWTRLDFASRQNAMTKSICAALLGRTGSSEDDGRVWIRVAGEQILCRAHAIPAAFTVSAARELVGQPFLHDHRLSDALKAKRGGPLHIIACLKGATESQATKLLGFPDATLVTAPFGVFAADPVQNVQFAFITNCRDETTARHGVQRFFDWLVQTGEDVRLARRALARARIVRAISAEAVPP